MEHFESNGMWIIPEEEVFQRLKTSSNGLSSNEAIKRQRIVGLNTIQKRNINFISLFIRQFTGNPLIVILALATCIAYFLGEHISSYYIFGIIMVSVFLGFWNEFSAFRTVEGLLKKISPMAIVIRDGQKQEVSVTHLTIGDVVLLSQGSIIPADVRLIVTKDLEVNESPLTGESKQVHKQSTVLPHPSNALHDMVNIGFMGTSVESGSGTGVVIRIGKDTEFGKIAKSVTFIKPVTEFQKGLSHFGNLILRVILILTISIFIINFLLGKSPLEALLFSLAIAVGLTPELLPVIVTISLSHGAGKLAKKHVIAKQLISIENLGNMDVLCTDKTGTLTEGTIQVIDFVNKKGEKDTKILQYALLANQAVVHHKVIGNAIDVALWEYALKNHINIEEHSKKIDEENFDYTKKATWCAIQKGDETLLIVKGAPDTITDWSKNRDKSSFHKKFAELNNQGFRGIAIATKKVAKKMSYSWDDIKDLEFEGYITFLDIPKKSAAEALKRLKTLHVMTKVITGDNEVITKHIAEEVGIETEHIMTGTELDGLSDEKLIPLVNTYTIFARVSPEQKLRIIQALQKNGHTVGYLGDGINDIPSLHAADVGISVNTAMDVAKDSASIVLLRKGLNVIADGIYEGRKTFNNTIKYILMATSSNFGNMFSAAGASFFLSFLPMTPVQILLNNGLYDISQMSIPSDNVDEESLVRPRHWDTNFIKNYMIFFGPLSSIFDFLTFGVMLIMFHAKGALFQTGWFIESIATQVLVIFVIRTVRTPFFKSKPSIWLFLTASLITIIGITIPLTPFRETLGFVMPPLPYFLILIILTVAYLSLVEMVKTKFLKKYTF